MTYKTILLHLHDARRAQRALEAAVPMARDMNAHLIGLSVLPPFVVLPAMDGGGASVTVDEHRELYRAEVARLKEVFEEATRGQPFPAEWREADAAFGTAAGTIIDHGRCADIIVASQPDTGWGSSSLLEDPVRLAMASGRPVLLVPNKGRCAMSPKRVTVAWNGRREAARATFDALPLLKLAEAVNVLWLRPERDQPTTDLPTAEICASLVRHGVAAQGTEVAAAGGDVGSEIMRQATAFGSDLLVMGCYGHSRLREFILGGASRHVLDAMSLPVLMSH